MRKVKAENTTEVRVVPSMCGADSHMTVPALIDLFQDVSEIHASSVGLGVLHLEEMGLFWVISKMRLRINRMPFVGDETKASTWILPSDRISCERDFALKMGDETLSYSRTLWAALRRDSGKPAHMADFYADPDEILQAPDDEPFCRISRKFDGAEQIGSYRIRSIDIDRGGHMNNVNYVRAMLGCFSCEEIAEMDITELDMHFLLQCYEGETITFLKRESETAQMEIGALNDDGNVVFVAAIY